MAYAKLGRDSAARKALFRDLVTDLILNERIKTTEAKAKAVRSIAEKMITLAKRGDLHARRQAAAFVRKNRSYTERDGEEIGRASCRERLSVTEDAGSVVRRRPLIA